ncbi:MAG: tyrosine-protein phosphatase [Oscillospiraceae bacterium]|nr:tyrosine-protein phosphatase [Oscillospiraceae bacterium]
MKSLLKSTKNTRPLGGGSLRYVRSDALINLSEAEVEWLLENNITTIVDLRSANEVEQRPCCLAGVAGFTYKNIPITNGGKIPEAPELVPSVYLGMVDEVMWEVISTIEGAKSNVLYFCAVGKDRTGVVSALLLLRQGAAHEDIIADYLLSGENLKEVLEELCRKDPSIDINVITPRAEYMKEFMAAVLKTPGFQGA